MNILSGVSVVLRIQTDHLFFYIGLEQKGCGECNIAICSGNSHILGILGVKDAGMLVDMCK